MDNQPEKEPANKDMYKILLWHFYQPPGKEQEEWVRIISKQCYSPFTEWLAKDNSDFRVVVNINYSLVEHLIGLRLEKIIENLGTAAERGKIEFTGSAAYHPI